MFKDSSEKILYQISQFSHKPVYYGNLQLNKGKEFDELRIAKCFFKNFTCHEGCKACCVPHISIDYLPSEFEKYVPEDKKSLFEKRMIVVNNKSKLIYSVKDNYKDGRNDCLFITEYRVGEQSGLGCILFPNPPISCQSAPQIAFRVFKGKAYLWKQIFGRAWAFKEEVKCIFHHNEEYTQKQEDIKILKRFVEWAEYFEIPHLFNEVIETLEKTEDYSKDYLVWKKNK